MRNMQSSGPLRARKIDHYADARHENGNVSQRLGAFPKNTHLLYVSSRLSCLVRLHAHAKSRLRFRLSRVSGRSDDGCGIFTRKPGRVSVGCSGSFSGNGGSSPSPNTDRFG
jgi:hypothetical protein